MAVRYRKGRASPWQTYWNNPLTGKRECANFGTQHEAEKHDSLIKHRIKFDRESFAVEETEEEHEKKATVLTFEGAYLLYLRHKQFSKSSLQWQMQGMRHSLSKFGTMPLNEVARNDIEMLMNDMLKLALKPVTVRHYMCTLRRFLKWCKAENLCESVDFPALPPGRYQKFMPPTPEEIEAIISNASPHIARVVILGSQLGVRVGESELLKLTWADVDLERGIVRVRAAKKNPNAPWREVPVRKSLLPVFRKWQEEDATQNMDFVVHFRGKPIRRIFRAWGKTLRRAGITRRIRPYDLRHAFGTEMVAAGVDVGTVASLMGHSNPTMLLTHYQYVMDKQKRAAVEALPDVPTCAQSTCARDGSVK